MTLNPMTVQQAESLRDSVEREIQEVVAREMRSFIRDVKDAAVSAVRSHQPNTLLAAGTDEMPTLGEIATLWAVRVDTVVMDAVMAAYERVYRRWTDEPLELASPQMAASRDYIAQVRDRLVRGTHFSVTVYDESFDKIRVSLAQSVAEGWSRDQLAERIAKELSWEKNGAYWRTVKEQSDNKIDSILDHIGPPGNTAREHARQHDPRVQALRNDRNIAIKHLDAERSIWHTRATLIARTESTGAAGFGGLQALAAEGVATKVWMATSDTRTRPTHSAADNQEVKLSKPFIVGGAHLQFPGDPSGPVTEVANCRCTLIQGDL